MGVLRSKGTLRVFFLYRSVVKLQSKCTHLNMYDGLAISGYSNNNLDHPVVCCVMFNISISRLALCLIGWTIADVLFSGARGTHADRIILPLSDELR